MLLINIVFVNFSVSIIYGNDTFLFSPFVFIM